MVLIRKNKTTQTLQTIYQEKDGNVLELNPKENKEIIMPEGKGTYGSKVGRPPKKKKTKAKKHR